MKTVSDILGEYNEHLHRRGATTLAPLTPSITISRQAGSGGGQIAKGLAQELGYTLWDKELLDSIASRGHLANPPPARLDERVPGFGENLVYLLDPTAPDPNRVHSLLRESLRSLLNAGAAVILGRGAAVLAEPGQALRVLVIAPFEKRQHNCAAVNNLGLAAARAELLSIEAERRNFLRRVYNRDEQDLDCFDIVLNTGELTLDGCVHICLQAYHELCVLTIPREKREHVQVRTSTGAHKGKAVTA